MNSRHNSAIFHKFTNALLHNILCLSQLSELRSYSYSRLLDTRGRLSPAERHTNSNCLECLAHGRACLWGFRLEQASGGVQRLLFVFGVCTTIRPNTHTLFGLLFGPNRIRIEYSVQP